MPDSASGEEKTSVVAGVPARDGAEITPTWRIIKRPSPGAEPVEVLEFQGNTFLNQGIDEIWTQLCGGGGTVFSHPNARIGVGNGTVAADATQTGLQGTSTAFGTMEQNYPTFGANQQAVFRSTFGTASANFQWNEITVDNGGASPTSSTINVNRLVQSMGSKAAGTEWTAELTLSIS